MKIKTKEVFDILIINALQRVQAVLLFCVFLILFPVLLLLLLPVSWTNWFTPEPNQGLNLSPGSLDSRMFASSQFLFV